MRDIKQKKLDDAIERFKIALQSTQKQIRADAPQGKARLRSPKRELDLAVRRHLDRLGQ